MRIPPLDHGPPGPLRRFAAARLHNASLTSWARDGDRLRPVTFDDVGHLADAGVEVTRQGHV